MPWSIFTQGGGTGSAVTWAEDLLKAIGAPVTEGNKQFIYDWEVSEGGGGKYNPLNQGPVPSQPKLTSTGQQYGGGAADYVSWQAGLQGAAAYLNMPNYSAVLAALKANNPQGARTALFASPWASSHYGYGSSFSSAALPGQATALPPVDTSGSAGGGGGGGGGGSSWLQSVASDLGSVFTLPGSLFGDIAGAGSDLAGSVIGLSTPFVKFAKALDWFFVPSHWVRIFAGLGGGFLVGAGVWNLSHTGRSASRVMGVPISAGGSAALPIGIAETTAGAVLLFVAFHNLPPNVSTLPALIGYLWETASNDLAGKGPITPSPAASGGTPAAGSAGEAGGAPPSAALPPAPAAGGQLPYLLGGPPPPGKLAEIL